MKQNAIAQSDLHIANKVYKKGALVATIDTELPIDRLVNALATGKVTAQDASVVIPADEDVAPPVSEHPAA